jgi:hypothetical protein
VLVRGAVKVFCLYAGNVCSGFLSDDTTRRNKHKRKNTRKYLFLKCTSIHGDSGVCNNEPNEICDATTDYVDLKNLYFNFIQHSQRARHYICQM